MNLNWTLALLLLTVVSLILGRVIYHRLFDPGDRRRMQTALRHNGQILLVLVSMLLIAILALFLGSAMPIVAALLMIVWGGIGAFYWARQVAPAAALQEDIMPPGVPTFIPKPDKSPLPAVLKATERWNGEWEEGGDSDLVEKDYQWEFSTNDGPKLPLRIQLQISEPRYATCRAEPRLRYGQWAAYVTTDMPEVDQLVAYFHEIHNNRGWSTLEQASNALSFTQQCITYGRDRDTAPGENWPRYPIETLMDEVGDCKDNVILVASILKRLGFEVALLYYPRHLALGVAGAEGMPGEYVIDPGTGLHFFYAETTATGWHIGDVPDEYRGLVPDTIEIIHRIVYD